MPGSAPRLASLLLALAALVGCAQLPGPARIDAVPDSWAVYEGREVRLRAPLTVVDTFRLPSEGVIEVSFNGRQYAPTEIHAPGPEANALAASNQHARISLELGGQLRRLAPGPARPWRTGTVLRDVVGTVIVTQGAPRLRLTAPPRVEQAPRPATPPAVGGDLVLASFNVLGYFNGDGAGGGFPTERGAATHAEHGLQRAKTLATLAALRADVLALNELENDGYGPGSAIADLCASLNAELGPAGDYRYVVPPTPRLGGDAIAVGMLYRSVSVAPRGAAAVLQSGAFVWGNRAPLLQSFDPVGGGKGFTVVVNHLKSKASCPADDPANADQGDGQSCWNALRRTAAAELADWIARQTPGEDVLILGDLNAHGNEDPVRALKSRGYTDVVAKHAAGKPQYSYVFKGLSGSLDHALGNSTLVSRVTGAAKWHVNADEHPGFAYDGARSHPVARAWYRPDPYRSSDHDPLLLGLKVRLSSDWLARKDRLHISRTFRMVLPPVNPHAGWLRKVPEPLE